MADTITVTLLRHGVTKANQERRYLGWTDLPLIPEEMERLKVVQNFGEQFDLCITSDLLRSRQTAEMLCPTLERIALKNFREIHFGTWEMKTYKDLKANSHYRTWIDKPENIVPPRGESFQEMKQRVDNGFQQLRVEVGKRNSRNILLVAHGGVIRYLLTRWTKEQETFFEREITHEAGIRLTWKLDDWKDEKKCISLQEAPLMVKGNG